MSKAVQSVARAAGRMVSGSKRPQGQALVLYVGNIPWTVSRRELREHFQPFGEIRACKVAFNYETGLSRGYGFVCYQDQAAAQNAIDKQPHVLDGCTLNISKSFSTNLRSFNTDFTAK